MTICGKCKNFYCGKCSIDEYKDVDCLDKACKDFKDLKVKGRK